MNSVSRISWFSLEECFQGLEQHVIKAAFTVVYGPKFVPAFQRNSQAYCELEVYMNPTKVKYHMQEKFLVSQWTCLPDLAKGHSQRASTVCIILCKENLEQYFRVFQLFCGSLLASSCGSTYGCREGAGRDFVPSLAPERRKVARTAFKGGKLSPGSRTVWFPVGLTGIQDLPLPRDLFWGGGGEQGMVYPRTGTEIGHSLKHHTNYRAAVVCWRHVFLMPMCRTSGFLTPL